MSHANAGKPAIIAVDSEDPPAFSCAECGWAPGCTGTPGPLLWAVIRHWLITHWELGPGEAAQAKQDQDQQDSR